MRPSPPSPGPRAALLIACLAFAASRGLSGETGDPTALPAAPAPPATSPGDAPSAGDAPPAGAEGEGEGDLFALTLPLDLATASFYELADWALSLGLSAEGSAGELRARIAAHYGVRLPETAAASGRTVVIESASSAEYFEVEESEDGAVRLSGGVRLLVTEEGERHRIEAAEIVYDRARNAVSARGGVHYLREGGSRTEEFRGETLAADLDDWSGVFLDGRIRRAPHAAGSAPAPGAATDASGTPAPGERSFVFTGTRIERRPGDLILLEGGSISSCDEEDPHYSIRASRMWLLGPGEWAVAGATLYIGRVPVFWLPFFYYPGEEIVFHPVLGYRSREGRFVQTSTWILGRKPASTASSGIFSAFQEGSDGPKELRGFFLRSLPGAGRADTKPGPVLKLLADAYSGLGYFGALELSLPAAESLEKLSATAGIGVSRSLFSLPTGYSPFVAASGYESIWNTSRFLGGELPFRFGASLSAALRFGGLRLAAELPLYSDPFVDSDFRARSEDMDWLGLSESAQASSPSRRASFTDSLSLSWTGSPKALAPLVGSIELTKLQSSLSWLSRGATRPVDPLELTRFLVDPAREFFYPDTWKPLDAAASIKGSLDLLGAGGGSASAGRGGREGGSPGAKGGEPALRSPWEEEGGEESGAMDGAGGREAYREPGFREPAAAPSPPPPAGTAASSLSLDWSLTPSGTWERRFLSEEWKVVDDIDAGRYLYELFSYKLQASLGLAGSFRGGLVTGSAGLAWLDQDQYRALIDDPAYAERVAQYRLADLKAAAKKLSGSFRLAARPFAAVEALAASSLGWSLDSTLYGRAYDAGAPGGYGTTVFGWNPESITRHEASAAVSLVLGGRTQTLGLAASLPPTLEGYSASLALDAGREDYGARLSSQVKARRPSAGADLAFDPLGLGLTLSGPEGLSLADSLSWDIDDARPVSNALRLSAPWFSLALSHRRAVPQKPVLGEGWKADGAERLIASSFDATLKAAWTSPAEDPRKISLSLNASYSQGLVRFTDSLLSLGLSASVKLPGSLTVGVSSLSQNKSPWRYWPGLFPAIDEVGGADAFRVPVLRDLVDSLSFWDPALRERSLLKLRSLSLDVTRELHDWYFRVQAGASPVYDPETRSYSIETSLSFNVAWRDIPQIKAAVERKAEEWSF